jgi:hypothetical protein
MDILQRSYEEAQREHAERYNVVSKIEHVSELTKWLREMGYHDRIKVLRLQSFQRHISCLIWRMSRFSRPYVPVLLRYFAKAWNWLISTSRKYGDSAGSNPGFLTL